MSPDPISPVPSPTAAEARKAVPNLLLEFAQDAAGEDKHDVALDAFRMLQEKPGVRTTEFWLALACGAIGTILQFIPGRENVGAMLVGLATAAYTLSRGIAKKAPARVGVLLFALVFLAGCSSPGKIKASAIDESLRAVVKRHDDYVRSDAKLTEQKRTSFLRTTELLLKTLDEARKSTEDVPVQSGQLAPAATVKEKSEAPRQLYFAGWNGSSHPIGVGPGGTINRDGSITLSTGTDWATLPATTDANTERK